MHVLPKHWQSTFQGTVVALLKCFALQEDEAGRRRGRLHGGVGGERWWRRWRSQPTRLLLQVWAVGPLGCQLPCGPSRAAPGASECPSIGSHSLQHFYIHLDGKSHPHVLRRHALRSDALGASLSRFWVSQMENRSGRLASVLSQGPLWSQPGSTTEVEHRTMKLCKYSESTSKAYPKVLQNLKVHRADSMIC